MIANRNQIRVEATGEEEKEEVEEEDDDEDDYIQLYG